MSIDLNKVAQIRRRSGEQTNRCNYGEPFNPYDLNHVAAFRRRFESKPTVPVSSLYNTNTKPLAFVKNIKEEYKQ
jgi:hypothetical protein